MRVTLRPHPKTPATCIMVFADKTPVGHVIWYRSAWRTGFFEGSNTGFTPKELARIHAAAEKKCTTLNILRRLTL